MSKYTVLELKDSELWREYIEKMPASQQDVYYTPEYYSLYQNYGDGQAQCFVFEDDGQTAIYPYLINSVNAKGYELDDEYFDIQGSYGYNGIISSTDEETFIRNFHRCFDSYCNNRHIIAEFSRFNPLLENVKMASPDMKLILSRLTVKLDLQLDLEDIWMQQFATKNRNVIRKTEKEGVIICESEDYETFRRLYNGTMENVSADDYYFFPTSYFDEYKEKFKGESILIFAMLNNEPIAGSMFMFSKDYAHYHLSARDKNYYKLAANNLVLWYGIQKAKERGCKWFHLGGGTTGDESDRLLHFKRNFSKESGEFWIGKRVHIQDVYDKVVGQWQKNYPEKWNENKIKLLGYRDI